MSSAENNRPMIFFDFDGTIIDMTERWWQLHLDVAKVFKLPQYEQRADYIFQKRNGVPEISIMQKIAGNIETIKDYEQERVRRIELPEYLLYDKLFFDSIATLRTLGRQGHALVIITKRRSQEAFNQQLNQLGLQTYFQNVLVAEGISKQILLAQNYTADELKQSMFVSDNMEDIEIAWKFGMLDIAAGYGCRTSEFLASSGAKNIISSLADVLSYV